MTLSEKQQRVTFLAARLIDWAYLNGYALTLGQAWRTMEQQEIYIKQGLSRTKGSKHLDRLAIDLNLFVNGEYKTATEDYRPLGEFWKLLDPECVWGGDWGFDGNHFQYGQ